MVINIYEMTTVMAKRSDRCEYIDYRTNTGRADVPEDENVSDFVNRCTCVSQNSTETSESYSHVSSKRYMY